MKNLKLLFLLMIVSSTCIAQQILPVIEDKRKDDSNKALAFDKQDKIFIFGSGSTDALELDKLTASGGLNMAAKPVERLTLFLNFNFGGSVIKKEKADSVYLSSFYFPDIASTAFSGSASFSLLPWKFKTNAEHQLLLGFDGSVQERNINRDTILFNLSLANFNVGPKYQWLYSGRNDNNAIITVGVFYNQVFINDNSQRDFNTLFNPSGSASMSMPSDLKGINGLISVQFNSALVYFRTYTDLNRGRDLSFSLGIKAIGKFFSF
jgi:hypothetical protein